MMVAVAEIMLAAAQTMQGPSNEAVTEVRQSIAAYRATGTRLQSTHHLTLFAQALAACGHYGEGLAALREAATLVADAMSRRRSAASKAIYCWPRMARPRPKPAT
jgi:hypothetical protein